MHLQKHLTRFSDARIIENAKPINHPTEGNMDVGMHNVVKVEITKPRKHATFVTIDIRATNSKGEEMIVTLYGKNARALKVISLTSDFLDDEQA
jgi:hypothetical protein